MPRKRQLITSDEAIRTDKQHTRCCSDCPWARTALSGWLGSEAPDWWIDLAHGEGTSECHTRRSTSPRLAGPQCAGLAIYRANVCKSPRDKTQFVLPADRVRVFANAKEFLEHHNADSRGEE